MHTYYNFNALVAYFSLDAATQKHFTVYTQKGFTTKWVRKNEATAIVKADLCNDANAYQLLREFEADHVMIMTHEEHLIKGGSDVDVTIMIMDGKTLQRNTYTQSIPEGLIDQAHEELSQKNPNDFVNFSWLPEGAISLSFICGMRYGQKIDQEKYAAGEMSWEEYCSKW